MVAGKGWRKNLSDIVPVIITLATIITMFVFFGYSIYKMFRYTPSCYYLDMRKVYNEKDHKKLVRKHGVKNHGFIDMEHPM